MNSVDSWLLSSLDGQEEEEMSSSRLTTPTLTSSLSSYRSDWSLTNAEGEGGVGEEEEEEGDDEWSEEGGGNMNVPTLSSSLSTESSEGDGKAVGLHLDVQWPANESVYNPSIRSMRGR